MDNMVQLQRNKKGEQKGTLTHRQSRRAGGRKGGGGGGAEIVGMPYIDDEGIVSRLSEGLERKMAVIVTACSAFGHGLGVLNGDHVPAH